MYIKKRNLNNDIFLIYIKYFELFKFKMIVQFISFSKAFMLTSSALMPNIKYDYSNKTGCKAGNTAKG